MRPFSRFDAPTNAFALNSSALDLTGPFPSPLSMSALLGGEVGTEVEELAAALRKWWPYIPRRFRPLVVPWVAAIERASSIPVSRASLKSLRGMMRRDITELSREMWSAPPAVVAAWIKFYPDYVAKLIAERRLVDPLLMVPADEHAQAKCAENTKADTGQKQALVNRTLAAQLFRHVRECGTQIAWKPAELAISLSSKKGGPRIKPKKLREAAELLVRIDAAAWLKRESGQPWAIALNTVERQRLQRQQRQRSALLH